MKQSAIKIGISLFIIGICLRAGKYPEQWWKKVDPASAPKWEILPQDASLEKNDLILSKRNGFGDFGNFASTPFSMMGVKYGGMEGFIQSLLFPEGSRDRRLLDGAKWPRSRKEVSEQSGFEAYTSGKEAEKILTTNKIDWVSFQSLKVKYKGSDSVAYGEIVEAAMRAKLDSHPDLKKLLVQTGNLKLRPEHFFDQSLLPSWKYWEVYMKLRNDLNNNPNKKLYKDNWFELFKKKYPLPDVSEK